jgi:hypothetical protein
MKPRFQFSLRNALEAMFWLSVCGGSFAIARKLESEPFNPWGWPPDAYVAFIHVLVLLIVGSPFTAIGALFGRTGIGAIAGLLITSAVWLALHAAA